MGTDNLQRKVFADTAGRPAVTVAGGQGPYENARRALASIDLAPAKGLRVLLKPNAGRIAEPESGVTTHPQVVAAAIDVFAEAGAEVWVGDSPITGLKSLETLEASGIAAVARERGCRVVDMDARRAVKLPVPGGRAMHEFKLCAEVLECDAIVSIPVVKMHMHTGVTLAVKNMKGCLWRRSKVDLHMLPPIDGDDDKPLNIAIADMASVLRPHLSLIDGTVGMEGLGPSAGETRELDVVVAGVDAFAADSVACRLMGVDPLSVPHLRIGAERGCGVIDPAAIDVTPMDWERWKQEFAPAPRNLAIDFPNVKILDRNSCSACQSTLLLFLRRHGKDLFDYFPSDEPLNIAIGKGHDDLPPRTLCIGNCTARHKDKGIFVSGCPPVGSAILKAIKKATKS